MRIVGVLLVIGSACDRGAPLADRPGETTSAQGLDATGTQVPAFTAPLLHGGRIDTSHFVGQRPLVLIFWSTWCDPCIAQLPHLVRFHAQYRDRVEMVSVAVDDKAELPLLESLVAKHRVGYPVAVDLDGASVLPRFSKSTGLPLILVIDAKGHVQFVQRNYAPGDERALGEAIDQVARAGS